MGQLTNEERAKMFAMYWGQNIVTRNEPIGNGAPVGNALSLHVMGMFEIENHLLILRPLSDMTEEEVYEYDEIQAKGESVADTNTKFGEILIGCPECFLWLLSKHFDLFGLIESGLAIDRTTLTN